MSRGVKTITLMHEVITFRTIEVSDDDVAEITSRWSRGDHAFAVEAFADSPEETERDCVKLFSPIWYGPGTAPVVAGKGEQGG